MRLSDIIQRNPTPLPWAEKEKIPWNEPEFSRRMLKEHLSQDHDAASRREVTINAQVNWIQQQILAEKPQRVLDLGCGPGLYTQRLALLGHTCTGIDFSPASLDYARLEAQKAGLPCTYLLGDLRQIDFGQGYDLVMFIFGELNTFRPEEVRQILQKAYAALNPTGKLLLEISHPEQVRRMGQQPPTWYSAQSGLMSAGAFICLQENFWDETTSVATKRFFVIDAQNGNVTQMNSVTQACTNDGIKKVIREAGFSNISFFPGLGGEVIPGQEDFFAVLAAV